MAANKWVEESLVDRRQLGWTLGLCFAMSCAMAQGASTPAPLPAETLGSGGSIASSSTERVYVTDIVISHISDGRIRVFDARSGRFLGMVSTAYAGNFTVNPARQELYVATTHLSRSSRGERTDVLEVHDTETLGFKYEVILPPKRAQALNYRGLVRTDSTGQWVYVQNATPATSITVVDLSQRKVMAEVATPGCWGILPAQSVPGRFSMLCGDGRIATVSLDAQGQVRERQVSDKLFDPDEDAWFHHAEQNGDRYWFVSFHGRLTEVDLGGPVAQVKKTTMLVDERQARQGWRPGGYQLFAIDAQARHLVVAMHAHGGEGSHKRPAQQLWSFDLQSGKRIGTAPGHGVISLTFSHQGERLQAIDGEQGGLFIWRDGNRLTDRPSVHVLRAGESPMQLESHD